MKKGKCSNYYPKKFQDKTSFDENGFTLYKHRNTGIYVQRNEHGLDNKWVVHIIYILLKNIKLIST